MSWTEIATPPISIVRVGNGLGTALTSPVQIHVISPFRSKRSPIVMITAANERDEVVEAITSGVNDYLVKPFAAGDVRKKLSKLVLRAHLAAQR